MSEAYHEFRNYAWKSPLMKRERGKWRSSGGNPFSTIPACTFLPVITGIPTQGQPLTASEGTWTQIPSLLHGPPILNEDQSAIVNEHGLTADGTFVDGMPFYQSYFQWQWYRQPVPILNEDGHTIILNEDGTTPILGGPPIPILGGIGPLYTPNSADVGHQVVVEVIARNIVGVSFPVFSRALTITGPLAIAGTPVTSAAHGAIYAGFTVAAVGGTGPYTYNLIHGAWPVGITMDGRSGVVAGVPKSAGVSSAIIVQARDQYGLTANLPSFSITVS